MPSPTLSWLAEPTNWNDSLKQVSPQNSRKSWADLVTLANYRLDLLCTARIDKMLLRLFGKAPPPDLATKPIRLAVLGSSNVNHLFSGIRIGALRRGLWVTIHQGEYGQYNQALLDPTSELRTWAPTAILLALDARHLLAGFKITNTASEVEAGMDRLLETLRKSRQAAREMDCEFIIQTALPIFPELFGSNEHRLPGSPASLVTRFNQCLRQLADNEGFTILALDQRISHDGLNAWYDPVFWYRAKQEIHLDATPQYGDLVARLLAAQQGRSFKCLVLDLDNTLWGGVIGDDGLDGITLGQGSALGEAFVAFQQYALDLSKRGVILAVCSKNDMANALLPFEKHPDMLLKHSDIACFMASWDDKATAIRSIAQQLNIGLDAIVFADDNPAERAIVRRELPMVAVPELPEDPALYATTIALAGYFEAIAFTADDSRRTAQYQENALRSTLQSSATDLAGYLQSLQMVMHWSRFTTLDRQRIVQLINKTNQFNLTTCRYTETQVTNVIESPEILSLQIRLSDQFGDNGIVALLIGRQIADTTDIEIDTWLMSCRVLGRAVEQATINTAVAEATRLGAQRLIGRYRPSEKNAMVRDLFEKMGFTPYKPDSAIAADVGTQPESASDVLWQLTLETFTPQPTFIQIHKA